MNIKGEHHANVDQQLLFQRRLSVRERRDDVTSQLLYELCPYPAVLFESLSVPLQPNKAVLADYVWKSMKEEQRSPSRDVQYVFDGNGLLHRVPWPRGSTCESVSHLYVRYVTQKYGAAAIVFDEYTNYRKNQRCHSSAKTGGLCRGASVLRQWNGDQI